MKWTGVPVFPGVVSGPAFRYMPRSRTGSVCAADTISEPKEKILAYDKARVSALEALERDRLRLEQQGSPHAKILGAHQMLLRDVAMDEEIRGALECGSSVTEAVNQIYDAFISVLNKAENEFTRERVADLEDVRDRLLCCLTGEAKRGLSVLTQPVIVVAKELYPSDTALIDRDMVLAIVTENGGITSHTAVVARSLGIPTVLGVPGIVEALDDGEEVTVDGEAGAVYVSPTEMEAELCRSRSVAMRARAEQERSFRQARPVTRDGVQIQVELNLAGSGMAQPEEIAACDGVGLLRSEFLYMDQNTLPSEEMQYRAYCAVLDAFRGKPVILRTIDIGGDKQLPALPLPHEDNPFLGNRALRLCFTRPDLFRTQLRAALRASARGKLWIMFPMVASMDDWRQARQMTQAVMEELTQEGQAYDPEVPLGVMIEIPSIALTADQIAREADFASVGTNDLCQYMTAADRLNPQVSRYYQTFSPAMLRLLGFVARSFAAAGKPVGVCGEMAGDPKGALALIGLGYRSLSMNAPAIAAVKQVITGMSAAEAGSLLEDACKQDSAEAISEMLSAYVKGLEGHVPGKE